MKISLMRSLIAIACVNGVPVVAKAQQPPTPTVDEMQAQCLVETGQLRVALGQAQAQIIQLRKENADLKAKGEQKPPSDAIGVPSPGGGVQMKMQEPKK